MTYKNSPEIFQVYGTTADHCRTLNKWYGFLLTFSIFDIKPVMRSANLIPGALLLPLQLLYLTSVLSRFLNLEPPLKEGMMRVRWKCVSRISS